MLIQRSVLAMGGCVLASLASVARAQSATYVVDDNGGPGVNFTDLPTAIAAANPGDRLLVQTGSYSSFVLDKGLSVLAQGDVQTGNVSVISIPAGDVAVLAGLDTRRIEVSQCAGSVLFDQVQATDTPSNLIQSSTYLIALVVNSADVRFQRCALLAPEMGTANYGGAGALQVNGSRVELSNSIVEGGHAGRVPSSGCWDGNWGGHGVAAYNGSRVHLAATTVKAGSGTDGTLLCGVGGRGGDAVHASSGSSILVAGPASSQLRGGAKGSPSAGAGYIHEGVAAWIDSGCSLRYSGQTFISGGTSYPAIVGAATQAIPADPYLSVFGSMSNGDVVELAMFGAPNFNARLQQGARALVVDDGVAFTERLNNRIRLHPLGLIPSGGMLALDLTVPAAAPAGWLRVFQGYEIDSSTNTLVQRTNSAFVVVR